MRPRIMLFACMLACAPIGAQEAATSFYIQGFYGFPNREAIDSDSFAPIAYGVLPGASPVERDVGSAWGKAGIKAGIAEEWTFPALVGGSALTRGNNIGLKLSGELSPVSLNAKVEASLTPIAFLRLGIGAGGGSGWDFGVDAFGLVDSDSGEVESLKFGTLVYRAWCAPTLQFDLAVLFPGDWSHVVAIASPRLEYKACAGAAEGEAWVWEADDGMNFNGWMLNGSYFLGYRMPLALDTAGLLVETERYIGSVASRSPMASGWGSDFTLCSFGLVLSFRLSPSSSLTLLPQLRTGRDWTDSTTRAKYFEDRDFDGPYLYFYRMAIDYSLKI